MGSAEVSIAVLGDGGWGTTLALSLHRAGRPVSWWGAFPDYADAVNRRHLNSRFLPGITLPATLRLTSNLRAVVGSASMIVLAIPAQHLRSVVHRLRALPIKGALFISVAKGIERHNLKRMSEVIHDELGPVRLAVLSGPNIAAEIARGQPASSVVASRRQAWAREVQRVLMSERLRIYTSTDVIGVELGGALKNPIAIAAGIGDGMGFGANAKAALITRGVVEMARLGAALGARAGTFWGLSGLGDLVTTCLSGRNRWLGEQLGRGRSLRSALASTPMVIEGVETSQAAVALGRRCRVELPIIEQVHAILMGRRSPQEALRTLMQRAGKAEAEAH